MVLHKTSPSVAALASVSVAFLFILGSALSVICASKSCRQPEVCSNVMESAACRHSPSTSTPSTWRSEDFLFPRKATTLPSSSPPARASLQGPDTEGHWISYIQHTHAYTDGNIWRTTTTMTTTTINNNDGNNNNHNKTTTIKASLGYLNQIIQIYLLSFCTKLVLLQSKCMYISG